ncbi:MAG: 2-oxoacid:acceptor oxidoreductase subunit alpha [Desulfobacteraceae bacterium]|jgi:2-oxoglutarate ferredoxin oxidoreductase subunit alpha|nr:2-oxoacid:acceptor oxidoreductase subunit alpha [Desulfobacteraceae bacterium]
MDISIRIGGAAGQGIQTISSIIARTFVRHDFYVFVNQDFESRIRGGHNFDQVRISNTPVRAVADQVQILIALDEETTGQDISCLAENGVLLFDGETIGFKSDDPNHLSVPFARIAAEALKSKIMINAVATGAAIALLDFKLQPVLDCIQEQFEQKGSETIEKNQKSAAAGYDFVRQNLKTGPPFKVPSAKAVRRRMLLTGSQAMAFGAMASGLKFYSGYPMSPATTIMEFISSQADKYKIVLEQAEDEIAAINMVIGASFAGARAMTATSGGGFCLMVEALSLAGMTETPVVIVVAQRPGPSTGLPTRTEQADLNLVIHAGHGDFPRAILAPGSPEQALSLMSKAFNLADKYQTPVIVLGDQYFGDAYFTVDELDLGGITIDRGHVLTNQDLPSPLEYRRYAPSESGISPRILPGQTKAVLYADSDEHTADGHITESAAVRNQMMRKRMQKLKGLSQEIGPPEFYPSGQADLVLLGWGSTHGAIKEAVDNLNQNGIAAQMLHYSELFPLNPLHVEAAKLRKSKIIAIENNFTGQFAEYFSRATGLSIEQKILKYDGRPFTSREIVDRIKDMI